MNIKKVLDLARWAPSGDNSQPWRFEVLSDQSAIIHGYVVNVLSEYDIDVYNYSHFAFGCMLENIVIAAAKEGYRAMLILLEKSTAEHPLFRVDLEKAEVLKDPLGDFISTRMTNRFKFSMKEIGEKNKKLLTESVSPELSCSWFETFTDKKAFAELNYQFARLVHPELSGIIEWNAKESKLHLPDESLGLSSMNLWMARLINKSQANIVFARKYLNGDFSSAFFGFYLPSLFSGCHVTFSHEKTPESYHDIIDIGRKFQRFWLTVTSLGLYLQMETGPLAFSRKVWFNQRFTTDKASWRSAEKMTKKLENLLGEYKAKHTIMMARIGYGKPPPGRATRLSLDELMYDPKYTNDNIWYKVKSQ